MDSYFVTVEGDSMLEALDLAKEDSAGMEYEWELYYKYDPIVVEVPNDRAPQQFAEELVEKDSRFASDVGCIKLGNDRYLFFGAYSIG